MEFRMEELQMMNKPTLMRLVTYFEIPHTSLITKKELVDAIYKKYGIKEIVQMSVQVERAMKSRGE